MGFSEAVAASAGGMGGGIFGGWRRGWVFHFFLAIVVENRRLGYQKRKGDLRNRRWA